MKKIGIACAAFLLGISFVQAQPAAAPQNTDKSAMQQRRNAFKNLHLTDDQKKQISAINKDYRKQFSDLRNDKSLTADENQKKFYALRKQEHQKVQSVLTPEQKTQLSAQRKDRMTGIGQKGERKSDARLDRMKSNLNLSDNQVSKIKSSQADFRSKMKDIRENKNLSDAQKKEQLKSIAKQQHESMKAILTAEQLQQLKNNHRPKEAKTAEAK